MCILALRQEVAEREHPVVWVPSVVGVERGKPGREVCLRHLAGVHNAVGTVIEDVVRIEDPVPRPHLQLGARILGRWIQGADSATQFLREFVAAKEPHET